MKQVSRDKKTTPRPKCSIESGIVEVSDTRTDTIKNFGSLQENNQKEN